LVGIFAKSKLKVINILTGDLNKKHYIRKLKNLKIKVSTLPFNKIFVQSIGLVKLLNLSKNKTFIIPLGATIIDKSIKDFNKMNLVYIGTFFQRNIDITITAFAKFYKNFSNEIPMRYNIIGLIDNEVIKFRKI